MRLLVNGTTLSVRVEGEGPALLLVHGFPDCGEVWRKQIDALVDSGFKVIVPDMRGCGQSDAPRVATQYAMSNLLEDLHQLLKVLKVDQVGLIGHDWGAAIAWSFLMAHPEQVTRYAALSVGHPLCYATDGLMQKLRGWYAVLFLMNGFVERLLKSRNWSVFRSITGHHAECDAWIEKLSRPQRLTAALNYYRANLLSMLFKRDYPPVLRPVMGLWSSQDKFLTERQMLRSADLAKAGWQYHRIEGASHWLQLDKDDEVNGLLINFFKGTNKA